LSNLILPDHSVSEYVISKVKLIAKGTRVVLGVLFGKQFLVDTFA